MKIGSKVKVVNQDIVGTVLEIFPDCNEVVIEDHDLEYPDNQLTFRPSDLKVIDLNYRAPLTVKQLIERLSSVPDKDIPVYLFDRSSDCEYPLLDIIKFGTYHSGYRIELGFEQS